MSLGCLVAALLLAAGALPGVVELKGRLGPLRGKAHWLAVAGLWLLALMARGGGQGAPQAQLALLALALGAGALLGSVRSAGAHTGRSLGLGAATSVALAGAFALPERLVGGGASSAGAGLLLVLLLAGGVAAGLLLVLVVEQWEAAGLGRKASSAVAPAVGLLLLATLPGLGRWTVGGGYGLLPQHAGLPVLARVVAGPSTGAAGRQLLATDLHSLPLRVPVPLANFLLSAAALLLVVALVLALLPGAAGRNAGAASAVSGSAGTSRWARLCLAAAGGLLLLAVAALAAGLLPGGPEPPATDVNRWLAGRFGAGLPASWQVQLAAGAGLRGAPGPLGAGLDLGALLFGGLLTVGAALPKRSSVVPAAAASTSGAGRASLGLALLAAALLAGVVASARHAGLPWTQDPRNLALVLALGCLAWARFGGSGPRTRVGLLLGALALLAVGLLAAGRGVMGPTLFDSLAVM